MKKNLTKAETLEFINRTFKKYNIKRITIPSFIFFSKSDFLKNKKKIILDIKKKFPILINTKQKIRNINHQIVKDIPIEIVARNILAHSLDVANIKQITDFIGINSMNEKLIIKNFYDKYFF